MGLGLEACPTETEFSLNMISFGKLCIYPLRRWIVLYSNPSNTAIVPAGEFGLQIVSIRFLPFEGINWVRSLKQLVDRFNKCHLG